MFKVNNKDTRMSVRQIADWEVASAIHNLFLPILTRSFIYSKSIIHYRNSTKSFLKDYRKAQIFRKVSITVLNKWKNITTVTIDPNPIVSVAMHRNDSFFKPNFTNCRHSASRGSLSKVFCKSTNAT